MLNTQEKQSENNLRMAGSQPEIPANTLSPTKPRSDLSTIDIRAFMAENKISGAMKDQVE